MPNNDYILRGDAVSAFCGNCEATDVCRQLGEPCEEVKQINAIPAADVEPVRHGRWKKSYADHEAFGIRPFFRYCSECHEATVHQYNYCPNCGAKMDAEPQKEAAQ